MTHVIGCDVGTQGSKGVLLSREGVVATADAPHTLDIPRPAWAQQDPTTWSDAVARVIEQLADKADGDVSHIGIDAQVDGVVATDGDFNPLHDAVIWMDRRGVDEVTILSQNVGEDEIFKITGLNTDASHSAPKMMWLQAHVTDEIRWMMPPAAYLVAWLTGEVAQDHANASSTMLYDVSQRGWCDHMVEASGISPEVLPPITDAHEIVGPVRPAIADRLGLDPSGVVVTGTGDDHAAAVAAGATRPGIIADITGTAEPIGTTAAAPAFDEVRLLETHAHAVPGTWFIENPGFVSGGSVLWVSQILGVTQGEVFDLAARAPSGSKGLTFVPALSGAMSPRWNDDARGSFTGASLDHGRAEMARAVLEGCTYALRDNVDQIRAMGLPAERINATGGGARSDLWLSMKADITGESVWPISGEGSAAGAAMLAAVAASWYPTVEEASDQLVSQSREPFEPNPETNDLYEAGYHVYREVYDALEPTFQRAE